MPDHDVQRCRLTLQSWKFFFKLLRRLNLFCGLLVPWPLLGQPQGPQHVLGLTACLAALGAVLQYVTSSYSTLAKPVESSGSFL